MAFNQRDFRKDKYSATNVRIGYIVKMKTF